MLYVDIKKRLGDFYLNVSFELESGILGILGASGCGKSMTLRCIAGIDRPDSGRIVLDGKTLYDSQDHINLPPQKRRVGYLFQNYALFPNMTVQENIMCGLHAEKDRKKREQAASAIIELLGLTGLENHRPSQISGGQAQRAALARILVNKPHLLMLDEPFSALDSNLRDQLQIYMKCYLEQYNRPVLMVTHSRDEAYRLCSRLALMYSGSFLALKPTKGLFANPGSVAGAKMTGCKNIASAIKTGDFEVFVPDWNIYLSTAESVKDDICAVGIRAHYFGVKTAQNRFPIYQTDEMEEPFEWIVRFRYKGQKDGTPDIWWRVSKEKKRDISEIGISPVNVLLLYPYQSKNK